MSRSGEYFIGLDVGSTTIKAVVVEASTDRVLWRDYQRHETRQVEKTLEFFDRLDRELPEAPAGRSHVFVTGSGAPPIARHLRAGFVQEVNAVCLAVERNHPDVQSVIELGGQDAKIIVFREDDATGTKRKIPSMNDKCAGGTGAVIDKIAAKLKVRTEELVELPFAGVETHPVAGKCGVFAETDINGLQKQGIPSAELVASLYESIVLQNLSVLTRGHTLRPRVLLLGGPNFFLRGLRQCWRTHLEAMWEERGVDVPAEADSNGLVFVPEDAHYFAAIGAIEFGRQELRDDAIFGCFSGTDALRDYAVSGRAREKAEKGSQGLVSSEEELRRFRERYENTAGDVRAPAMGSRIRAFLGLDAGSTSTKAVLIDEDCNVIGRAYQLSHGNPIEDAKSVCDQLRVHADGCHLDIAGAGTTGYAKDILKNVLGADVALVETVAHAESGQHFFPDADVIVDVGGQDIKVIVLKNGAVKDFKLNTQCSAGNGYFLQSTAASFGLAVEEYAETAFGAAAMPQFGYGCAVFMQSDIIDFQRQGWQAEEILAGLAAVLPKNIWLYVAQIPNLARLGRKFVLQGGTQYNLAAVKAQVDFIESRFVGTKTRPEVVVHPFCGEGGAIGAAMEARRLVEERGRRTTFIGLDAVRDIAHRTTHDERTRCYFCANRCLRTFIDVKAGGHERAHPPSKVPLAADEQRLIIATCDKGEVEDVDAMRAIKSGWSDKQKDFPNLASISAQRVFAGVDVATVTAEPKSPRWFSPPASRQAHRDRVAGRERAAAARIGIPRVLNMYGLAPFFTGFFRALGVPHNGIVWSDVTTPELYKEGAKRGSIDPCFPSKVAIPHVHNLLFGKHAKLPLTHIFFPMIDSFPTFLDGVQDSRACPTVCATPEATHAAFIKEGDLFREHGVRFKKTFLNLDHAPLCARQLHEDWGAELGFSEKESLLAVYEGLRVLAEFHEGMRRRGREILADLEREGRLGVVLLGRPYHNDPGLNHGIPEEIQKCGYPIFTVDTLPIDDQTPSSLSIADVWKNSYSENSSRKIWAAKFVARHPNLVALELSSFKCGHDAPIYTLVEEIVEASGTPFFAFKDIDENKPSGSIHLRVETIRYFLERYRERLQAAASPEPLRSRPATTKALAR